MGLYTIIFVTLESLYFIQGEYKLILVSFQEWL